MIGYECCPTAGLSRAAVDKGFEKSADVLKEHNKLGGEATSRELTFDRYLQGAGQGVRCLRSLQGEA
jgi:hypothetical protein